MAVHEGTLVLSQKRFRGWILDAFWRESSNSLQFKPECIYLYSSMMKNRILNQHRLLRQATDKSVLSIHQSSLPHLEKMGILEKISRHNVLVTHINSKNELTYLSSHYINNGKMRFLVMNKKVESNLMELGVPKKNITVIYGAVDRKMFHPNEKSVTGDYILIAGDCKERKNPDTIREVVRNNPHLTFVFENHAWEEVFSETKQSISNISFWDSSSSSVGDLYRSASVLCNLSFLEGGPIPVLQALASGTPILSSDVGFVSEVLTEGFGRVINLDLTIQEISIILSEVASTKSLVSTKDGLEGKFSWEDLGRNLFTFVD